jgi:hypothetical protein
VDFTVAGRALAVIVPRVDFPSIDSILVELLSEYLLGDFLCGQPMFILTLFSIVEVDYMQKI